MRNGGHRLLCINSAISLGASHGIGDLFVQYKVEGRRLSLPSDDNDRRVRFRRLGFFTAFGTLYGASFGHLLYNVVYTTFQVFSSRPIFTAAFDVLGNSIFLYMPTFYLTQVISERSLKRSNDDDDVEKTSSPRLALSRWRENFLDDLNMLLIVWVPLHAINFMFLPLHLRVPFISGAGLVWSAMLSMQRSRE